MRARARIEARLAALEAQRDQVEQKLWDRFFTRERELLSPEQRARVDTMPDGARWPDDIWDLLIADPIAGPAAEGAIFISTLKHRLARYGK